MYVGNLGFKSTVSGDQRLSPLPGVGRGEVCRRRPVTHCSQRSVYKSILYGALSKKIKRLMDLTSCVLIIRIITTFV
jgi:hypothetical protein